MRERRPARRTAVCALLEQVRQQLQRGRVLVDGMCHYLDSEGQRLVGVGARLVEQAADGEAAQVVGKREAAIERHVHRRLAQSVHADREQIVLDQRSAGGVTVAELGEDAAVGGMRDEVDLAIDLDPLQISDLAVAQRGESMLGEKLELRLVEHGVLLPLAEGEPYDGAPRPVNIALTAPGDWIGFGRSRDALGASARRKARAALTSIRSMPCAARRSRAWRRRCR